MIKLNCTNCRTEMEMDDAFAGGVCRCKRCGTIQTVPARAKASSTSAGKKKPSAGKALYSKSRVAEGIPSSGLDELAQAVASSGLSSGRLRRGAANRSNRRIAMISAAVVLAIAAGVWLSLRSSPRQATGAAVAAVPISAPSGDASAETSASSFCGVPLDQKVIIFVLDRGSGTSELFSYLKEVTLRSAESLGADRKFQIIFWNNGSDDAFPSTGPTFATAKNVELARAALDDINPHGQTDVTSALTQAVAANPDVIILATGKGGQLGDDFTAQVLRIRGEKPAKIYTFDIGDTELSSPLQTIADRTAGKAQLLSEGQIKHFAKE